MPKIKANGIDIFYAVQGQGDPLLLIAGLTRSHLIWQDIATALSKQYQVILLDNRGAGQTDKPNLPYTIELMAEDIAALISALDLKKFHILGHSMGGFMAMHLAAKYPELLNKLVLTGTAAAPPRAAVSYFNGLIELIDSHTPHDDIIKAALPWLYTKRYLQEPNRAEFLMNLEKNNPHPQPTYALKRQIEACLAHDAHPALPKITAPTLVICGAEDTLLPPETSKELADSIPGSKLKIIPGAAHMLQIEEPVVFLQEITTFLG